ncbi:KTSC domain-containing protein [Neorhizobium sp. DAR64861/K0K2]|uniref:KTSC domain-containing protein n=1 Tax=unclassified Neorhizobium TaxID=2629175 RepID=UPI003D2710EA
MQAELNSSLFDAAAYDEGAERLRLFMKNGQIREFETVPVQIFQQLAGSRSPGQYYIENIRSKFPMFG